jgi:hypothetical protein
MHDTMECIRSSPSASTALSMTTPVRTVPPKFELRSITTFSAAELEQASAMLAHAFDDSPLLRLAFPQDRVRARAIRAMFSSVLRDAVRFGRIEIAYHDRIVGMLIWYPPGRYPVPAWRMMRLIPDYARMVLAGPAGLLKLLRAQLTLNRLRPAAPHCHGYFLGGRQGDHVGGALIKRLFEEADAIGAPVYLETQEPRSTKLYARLGFTMLKDGIETLPGGPLTWTMWREPRTARRPPT